MLPHLEAFSKLVPFEWTRSHTLEFPASSASPFELGDRTSALAALGDDVHLQPQMQQLQRFVPFRTSSQPIHTGPARIPMAREKGGGGEMQSSRRS